MRTNTLHGPASTRVNSRRGRCRYFSVFLLFIGIPWACFGQVDRSSLTGTVRDASGHVVPETAVVARRADTGLERRTISTSDGAYSLGTLPIGIYTVVFSKPCFQEIRYNDVEQAVGRTRVINPVLAPSNRNEEVSVSASLVQLDETSAALGGRVEEQSVDNLPLNGRNWASLTALVPGA